MHLMTALLAAECFGFPIRSCLAITLLFRDTESLAGS